MSHGWFVDEHGYRWRVVLTDVSEEDFTVSIRARCEGMIEPDVEGVASGFVRAETQRRAMVNLAKKIVRADGRYMAEIVAPGEKTRRQMTEALDGFNAEIAELKESRSPVSDTHASDTPFHPVDSGGHPSACPDTTASTPAGEHEVPLNELSRVELESETTRLRARVTDLEATLEAHWHSAMEASEYDP